MHWLLVVGLVGIWMLGWAALVVGARSDRE